MAWKGLRPEPEREDEMGDVLILGGGVCGLATAMMLGRDGHDVTVVESNPAHPPALVEDAVESWERPGVTQFRLAHYMQARFRHVLDADLPDVRDALMAAGATRYNLLDLMPPFIEDRAPRPDDDRYWTLTARRPVLETVFAHKAQDERNVSIVRGTKITRLVTGSEAISGVPHVVGVRTEDGAELRADIVVDAMGRRSALDEWLPAVGGRPPHEEAEDCGFTYYERDFRSRDGSLPQAIGPLAAELGPISVLTLPGDNDTWMIVVFTASGDRALKQLRFEDKWRKVVEAVPFQAHWLEGEPIGDFKTMAGIMDRIRRFVVNGTPVVTGLLPVADAWACTNPSRGRGVSIGIWHAQRLRDLLRSSIGEPKALSAEWDAITETEFAPWYKSQVEMDRARVAEIIALREGRELPVRNDPQAQMTRAFFTAMAYDPDVFRAFLEVMGCLATPQEVMSRPGMFEKVISIAEDNEPVQLPGPTREELLELVV